MSVARITIPAAANGQDGVYTQRTDARVFGVVSSSGEFTFQRENDASMPVNAGDKFGSPDGKSLGRITLKNSTATAINATIFLGNADFKSAGVVGKDSAVSRGTPSVGETNLASGGLLLLSTGTDTEGRRLSYLKVTHTHATAVLDVQNLLGINFDCVFPRVAMESRLQYEYLIYNPSAGTVTVRYALLFDEQVNV